MPGGRALADRTPVGITVAAGIPVTVTAVWLAAAIPGADAAVRFARPTVAVLAVAAATADPVAAFAWPPSAIASTASSAGYDSLMRWTRRMTAPSRR